MLGRIFLTIGIDKTTQHSSFRFVSSKYTKPFPRPFRRRLFEAAVAPVLPRKIKVCSPKDPNAIKTVEYDEVELALAQHVKKWMVSEEFRVMAVCQFLPVTGRTLWFAKNQLRMKGLEFRTYGNRIMRKVFEGTPLTAVNNVLVGYNAFLFGKDLQALKTIKDESEKLSWIVPLVCFADSRLLSMEEVTRFSQVRSLDDHRVNTGAVFTTYYYLKLP
ncbi:hypothetical protein DICVIV_06021 [Dictyocaulus viviparus]|uniref:Large ribosomal subunit protein uL10m n=1 Tax=Dictyocaulus viviparus TaxID=29172 RepID=A0A0D8XTF3_DICVI|nr:hypothetical protein DICVIV_06021 [Dictyocaulus viviparus]